MIDSWTTRLRLLWRQEWTQLLPALVGERGQAWQLDGSGQLNWHGRSLTPSAQPMKALCRRLMLAPPGGPVQAHELLFPRLAQRLHQATHFCYTQRDPPVCSFTFFSCARLCSCITTTAAWASKASVI